MERCTGHTIRVFDRSGRQHTVSVKYGLPTCTCAAFLISKARSNGWCAHIEAQINLLCNWRGKSIIVPGKCPKCSKDTEIIDE